MEKSGETPTPPLKCVNALDKGVRWGIDGKAADKGLRGEPTVNGSKLKAAVGNSRLSEVEARRSRCLAGACMLPFFSCRKVEACGRDELRE